MADLPTDIDFALDPSASPERFNRASAHVHARLKALETYRPALDDLLKKLQQLGMDRLNDALAPVYRRLQDVQALGFLNAPLAEGTSAHFAVGATSVTIAADRRALFTPSPWVALVRELDASYALARVVDYDPATGALDLTIANVVGSSGDYADVSVWGVAGGAMSALESARATSADRAATHADQLAAGASAASAASAAASAASLAALANSQVLSVNGHGGQVVLAAADVGALAAASNLFDLASPPAARQNLGLGNAATGNIGAIAGTVAAGDDARITGSAQKSANLSDLANAAMARANLGLAAVAASGAASDVSGLAASATVDATNAANIASGVLPAARLPAPTALALGGVKSAAAVAHQFVSSIGTDGVPTLAQPAAADVSGLSPSATVDATNAANIASGVLPAARGGTGAGAFTQGSVAFAGAGGVYTQDNAAFFWDNINNRLGVGTNAPASPLHVVGQVRIDVAAVPLIFKEIDQTAPTGLWRMVVDGGEFRLDRNTDAAGAFATIKTPWWVGPTGLLTLGESGQLSVPSDGKVTMNNGLALTGGLSVDTLTQTGAELALTDGTTIAWDMSLGHYAKVTLGGNRTLAAPTNATAGNVSYLRVIQDATGSRTLAWNVAFDWGAAGAPTLTTTANKHDLVTLYCTVGGATPSFDCVIAKGF